MLNALAQQYSRQYNFVAITFEEAAKVHAFLAKRPFDFIHLTDAKKFIDASASAYPTTVLLDHKGTIQHVRGGLAYQFDQNGQLKVGDGKDWIALLRNWTNYLKKAAPKSPPHTHDDCAHKGYSVGQKKKASAKTNKEPAPIIK